MQYIKGVQPISLIDYPGQIAAVVFLGGCNLRCQFCHNPELVLTPGKIATIPEEEFFSFLDKRVGKIEGIVITGGEPCLHKEIVDFVRKVKEKGFLVKLDTNGTKPEVLKEVLPYVDYIAMDIKSDLENYNGISGLMVDLDSIKESVTLIKNSGKEYEFRTTVFREGFDKEKLKNICSWLKGSKKYALQQLDKRNPIINEKVKDQVLYSKEDMQEFKEEAEKYFDVVELRNV